jgi:hypothetical protein
VATENYNAMRLNLVNMAKVEREVKINRDNSDGYDECTECGKRFNASLSDKRPVCKRCK